MVSSPRPPGVTDRHHTGRCPAVEGGHARYGERGSSRGPVLATAAGSKRPPSQDQGAAAVRASGCERPGLSPRTALPGSGRRQDHPVRPSPLQAERRILPVPGASGARWVPGRVGHRGRGPLPGPSALALAARDDRDMTTAPGRAQSSAATGTRPGVSPRGTRPPPRPTSAKGRSSSSAVIDGLVGDELVGRRDDIFKAAGAGFHPVEVGRAVHLHRVPVRQVVAA